MFAAILRASSFVSNLRDVWASNAAPEGQSSGSRNMLQAIVTPSARVTIMSNVDGPNLYCLEARRVAARTRGTCR
jgi:hypothetical protein